MPSAIPCSPFLLISRVHFCLFSEWTRSVSSKFFVTQVSSISTAKLVLTRHVRCVLSRLRCNGYCLLLSSYLSRIGRIKNSSYSPLHTGFPIHFLRTSGYSFPEDTRPRTPLILFCTVQLRTLCVARSLETLYLSATSGPGPGSCPASGAPWFSAMPPSFGRVGQQQQQVYQRDMMLISKGVVVSFTPAWVLCCNCRFFVEAFFL